MNLVLIEPAEISAGVNVTLSGARAAHLLNVLHVEPGHQVRIGVLDGPRGTATVQAVGDETVALHCELETEIPPRPNVDLLLAVARPKVMRRLWAQLAAQSVDHGCFSALRSATRNTSGVIPANLWCSPRRFARGTIRASRTSNIPARPEIA